MGGTRNGGFFPIKSVDGKDLYYTVSASPSVLRAQSLATGAERDVIGNIITLPGFAVTTTGIYYLSMNDSEGEGLDFFNFALRSSRRLTSFEKPVNNGFAVSPDGRRILFNQQETNDSNLMLLRNLPLRSARDKPSLETKLPKWMVGGLLL